jgi:hypothetical protein
VPSTLAPAGIVATTDTTTMPDGVIYKPCGNGRASVCTSCSTVYPYDAYRLLRAGMAGGKGIPDTVAAHFAVFVTFTAPLLRCRARAGGHPTHVSRSHALQVPIAALPHPPRRRRMQSWPAYRLLHPSPADELLLGESLCLDCYDHNHQVVWNLYGGERRFNRSTQRGVDQQHQLGL